ncbi:MAG: hypothetical protein V2J42_03235 [Wenzhouxiangella sp.]|jgi:hypothetical protein|nr:hypothetical protein [Wenzhouxiangella sp.]
MAPAFVNRLHTVTDHASNGSWMEDVGARGALAVIIALNGLILRLGLERRAPGM